MSRRRRSASPTHVDDDNEEAASPQHPVTMSPSTTPAAAAEEEEEEERAELVGDFRPGSIRRIKLVNFLTYAYVEFHPGPRLNMVVGANGTGKSSILNAICLGLGGEPKLLGRADDARNFIQHEKAACEIEIELEPLEDDDQPPIFGRRVDRSKGTEKGRGRGASTFYFNGQVVNRETIQELVQQKYHISLNNLCTFLPQDKVGSFSGMTPQELLLETQKTLSSTQHLYKVHQELIASEAELKAQMGQAGTVPVLQKKLDALTRDLGNLERAKERLEAREQALQAVELLQKKRLWTQCDLLLEQVVALKDQKKEFKEKLKAANQALEPLKEKLQSVKDAKAQVDNRVKQAEQQQKAAKAEMDKQDKKQTTHDDHFEALLNEASDFDNQGDQLQVKLDEATANVERYTVTFNELAQTEDQLKQQSAETKSKVQQLRQESSAAGRLLREQEREMQDLQQQAQTVQQKLANQQNARLQQQETVFRKWPELRQIDDIVKAHKADFRRPVVGPVATWVTPKAGTEKQHAAYLEQHVPNRLWKAYVVQTKDDQDLLYRLVREERNIPINIFMVSRPNTEVKRPYGSSRMAQFKQNYGIAGFLDELFTGPEVVMQCLRDQCAVHRVLSGSERTQDALDSDDLLSVLVQRDPDLQEGRTGLQNVVVCCHNRQGQLFKYQSNISDYSGKPTTRIDQVRSGNFLKATNENSQVAQNLQQQLEQIHGQVNELRPKLAETEKEKKVKESLAQEANIENQAAQESLKNFGRLKSKLDQAKSKLKDAQGDLEQYQENSSQLKADFAEKLKNRAAAMTAVVVSFGKASKLYRDSMLQHAAAHLSRAKYNLAERRAQEELEEASQSFKQLESDAVAHAKLYQEKRQDLAKVQQMTARKAPLKDDQGNNLPLKQQLEDLEVTTLEEIDAAIEEKEEQANNIVANPQVIQQYLQKVQEQKDLQERLDDARGSQEAKEQAIIQKRTPWQTALQNYVHKINALYADYMSEMGCTGEVRLKEGDPDANGNPSNFKDWGIEIKVSFRSGTKAQVLSAKVQSGGERSVSTIMYLMALQDLMISPFRCVDEINQGLDDRNERLVFRRIVTNSTKPPSKTLTDHSGQYFLITPKLLPNLYDMEEEATTVLFVFNGKFNFSTPDEWSVSSISENVRPKVEGEEEEEKASPTPRARKKRRSEE